MLQLFRSSIVFRSAAIVLGITLLVGALFSTLSYVLTMRWEREQVKVRMGELLNTVESTASIACFLMDQNLGNEVARGLLKNHFVSHVAIRNGSAVLAQASISLRPGSTWTPKADASAGRIVRDIVSPFSPQEVVCQIMLDPNEAVIQEQAANRSRFIVYLLLLQAFAVAGAVVFIVMSLITRPIKSISDRLHSLPVEEGEKLHLPNGHRKDEISRLVDDVNALLTKLVRLLGDERALRIQREIEEKKFRAIFENAETGIFVVDQSGTLHSYNRAFTRTLGIEENTPLAKINRILPDFLGVYGRRCRELIQQALAENHTITQDFRIQSVKDRPPKWISLLLTPIEENLLQGVVNDITERKLAEESAYQLAATDALTGVANRLGFDNELTRLVKAAQEGKIHSFFLIMIDLDWFKQVNDTYGHDAGDAVLRHFANVLKVALRKEDFIARLGGDEFVILTEATRQSSHAARIAQKIIDEVAHPIHLGNNVAVTIGTSIGIALFDPAMTKEALVKHADEAMYLSKQRGKNTYTIYGQSV